MKDVVNFLRDIKPGDDVVIIFNADADGICSSALVMKCLSLKKPYLISQPMPMDKNLPHRVRMGVPNKIIFLDLSADQQMNIINSMADICDILVIDHHMPVKNISKKADFELIHYNPRFRKKNIYQSTSYLAYKICSKIKDIKIHLWIAAVGMVADYNLSDSKDVVAEIKKNYGIKSDDLYESIFGKMADMISAVNATKELTSEDVVGLIVNSENPEDFMSNEKMVKCYNEVSSEISKIMAESDKKAEVIGSTIFLNLNSKFNLRSPIATKLSTKYPEKTIVIYQKIGTKIKVSMRNQGAKDLTKLLKKATEGIAASSGGHEKAAGAVLNAKDWDVFKERLIQ